MNIRSRSGDQLPRPTPCKLWDSCLEPIFQTQIGKTSKIHCKELSIWKFPKHQSLSIPEAPFLCPRFWRKTSRRGRTKAPRYSWTAMGWTPKRWRCCNQRCMFFCHGKLCCPNKRSCNKNWLLQKSRTLTLRMPQAKRKGSVQSIEIGLTSVLADTLWRHLWGGTAHKLSKRQRGPRTDTDLERTAGI